MKRTLTLFFLAVSLSFAFVPARATDADTPTDVLDELRSLGYTIVEDTIAPTEWEKKTFRTVRIQLIGMRSTKEVPAWPHAYYRFMLHIEEFANSADAAARLTGIRLEPPDLSAELRKSFPLRDGFRLGLRVYILSTDVSLWDEIGMPRSYEFVDPTGMAASMKFARDNYDPMSRRTAGSTRCPTAI